MTESQFAIINVYLMAIAVPQPGVSIVLIAFAIVMTGIRLIGGDDQ